MKRCLTTVLAGLSILASFNLPAAAEKPLISKPPRAEVGHSKALSVVPNLSNVSESSGRLVWRHTVVEKEAAFIKAHLVDVNLRHGDTLTLRSATGRVVEEITGRGPKGMGSFWALSAFGDTLELELSFRQPYDYLPFSIDRVILGDPKMLEVVLPGGDQPESICAPEDFDDVICYQSDPAKWANVTASVGVMSVGGDPNTALFCSGSNISGENFLLTNQHCVENQGQCDSSEFVFKFYRTGCNDGSPPTEDWQSFRCDQIVAQSPFISCDQGLNDLDFTLASVIGDPASTFGFVEPDPVPLTSGEAIYIVQHPDGRPHEITHGAGPNVVVDGTVLRYYDTLDTEGGSSGSPIFRDADDKLVGLHHCGGCDGPEGNRGMLMSDIYPLIEDFVCSETLSVRNAGFDDLEQLSGNGDGVVDPGEAWQLTPLARNASCDMVALGVGATYVVNPDSAMPVVLFDTSAFFGDIDAGTNVPAQAPIRFGVDQTAPCGETVILDVVELTADNGGPFDGQAAFFEVQIGNEPLTTVFHEDFSGKSGHAWSIVNDGTGSGPAETWTTTNPGNRTLGLTEPFAIADSDEHGIGLDMDEQLISPQIDVGTFDTVTLQFKHDFNYYTGGNDEQADVDIRSSATGGQWVTVANFSGGGASGTVTVDITQAAAGQSDLQVRFHYWNAEWEFWWAVDDIFVLGSNGFVCNADPVELEIAGSCPGDATVTISGASPGGEVAIAGSFNAGSYEIPSGDCAGILLALDDPQPRMKVVADQDGMATLEVTLSDAGCGRLIQALDLGRCAPSNVVEVEAQ